MGFMSTSRKRHIPLRYMGKGSNVLLCLRPNLETDEAYHSGAAISIISQFAAEDEVLCVRPLGLPCTQLAHSLHTACAGCTHAAAPWSAVYTACA
jgi:hypothetical protein